MCDFRQCIICLFGLQDVPVSFSKQTDPWECHGANFNQRISIRSFSMYVYNITFVCLHMRLLMQDHSVHRMRVKRSWRCCRKASGQRVSTISASFRLWSHEKNWPKSYVLDKYNSTILHNLIVSIWYHEKLVFFFPVRCNVLSISKPMSTNVRECFLDHVTLRSPLAFGTPRCLSRYHTPRIETKRQTIPKEI